MKKLSYVKQLLPFFFSFVLLCTAVFSGFSEEPVFADDYELEEDTDSSGPEESMEESTKESAEESSEEPEESAEESAEESEDPEDQPVLPVFYPQNGQAAVTSAVIPETPVFRSYSFAGWFTEPDGFGTYLDGTPEEGAVYYAAWKNGTHTIFTEPLILNSAETLNALDSHGLSWNGWTLQLSDCTVDLAGFGAPYMTAVSLTGGGEVVLSGVSTVRAGNTDSFDPSYGLASYGSLTISGSGSAEFYSGTTSRVSAGIYSTGQFICSAAVTGYGGEGTLSAGVLCESLSAYSVGPASPLVTGTLKGFGGPVTASWCSSYGICSYEGLSVAPEGTLIGQGGSSANGSSYGIYTYGGAVYGKLEGTGGTSGGSWGNSSGLYNASRSIALSGAVTVNGGAANGESSRSCGLFSETYFTNSGTLSACTKPAAGETSGIYAICGLSNSGTLKASLETSGENAVGLRVTGGSVSAESGSITVDGYLDNSSETVLSGNAVFQSAAAVSTQKLQLSDTVQFIVSAPLTITDSFYLRNSAFASAQGSITTGSGIHSWNAITSGHAETFTSGIATLTASGTDPIQIQAQLPVFLLPNGEDVDDPADPVWKNYTFSGWFTSPDFSGEPVSSGFDPSATYYSCWTRNGHILSQLSLDLTDPAAPVSGSDYSWDAAAQTLHLSGLVLETAETVAIRLPAGSILYLEEGSVNEIGAGTSSDASYGIYAEGDLTIRGPGSLTVSGGEAGGNSYGIFTVGSLTNEANISCLGTAAAVSSYGVYTTGAMTNSGEMTVFGGQNSENSYGMYVLEGALTNTGSLTGTGYDAGTNSYGLYSYTSPLYNSGRILAYAGASVYSNGINVRPGGLVLTSGTLEAHAGNGTGEYYGIWTSGDIRISGDAEMILYGCSDAPGNVALCCSGLSVTDEASVNCFGAVSLSAALTLSKEARLITDNYYYSYGSASIRDLALLQVGPSIEARGGVLTPTPARISGISEAFVQGVQILIAAGSDPIQIQGDSSVYAAVKVLRNTEPRTMAGEYVRFPSETAVPELPAGNFPMIHTTAAEETQPVMAAVSRSLPLLTSAPAKAADAMIETAPAKASPASFETALSDVSPASTRAASPAAVSAQKTVESAPKTLASPATGDSSKPGVWIALMAAVSAALIGIAIYQKKK